MNFKSPYLLKCSKVKERGVEGERERERERNWGITASFYPLKTNAWLIVFLGMLGIESKFSYDIVIGNLYVILVKSDHIIQYFTNVVYMLLCQCYYGNLSMTIS